MTHDTDNHDDRTDAPPRRAAMGVARPAQGRRAGNRPVAVDRRAHRRDAASRRAAPVRKSWRPLAPLAAAADARAGPRHRLAGGPASSPTPCPSRPTICTTRIIAREAEAMTREYQAALKEIDAYTPPPAQGAPELQGARPQRRADPHRAGARSGRALPARSPATHLHAAPGNHPAPGPHFARQLTARTRITALEQFSWRHPDDPLPDRYHPPGSLRGRTGGVGRHADQPNPPARRARPHRDREPQGPHPGAHLGQEGSPHRRQPRQGRREARDRRRRRRPRRARGISARPQRLAQQRQHRADGPDPQRAGARRAGDRFGLGRPSTSSAPPAPRCRSTASAATSSSPARRAKPTSKASAAISR